MTDLNALAERLEREMAEGGPIEGLFLIDEHIARQAAQALRGMGEALEPFAILAGDFEGFDGDAPIPTDMICVGELRTARSALKGGGGGE